MIETANPDGLPQPDVYRQLAVATGTRTVYLSGQVARDGDGNPVGEGDLAAQVEQAFVNVHTALTSVGATFDDVAKTTIYIVDYQPEAMGPFVEGFLRAADRLGVVPPPVPTTMIGVACLAEPDLLVEVEAIAVLD
jgi:enamine deaminase RidA (YjgF/YER057c/UK114 family)